MLKLTNKGLLKVLIFLLLTFGITASAVVAYFHVNNWLIAYFKAEQVTLAKTSQLSLSHWFNVNQNIVKEFAKTIATSEAPVEANPGFDLLIKQYTDSQQFEYLSYAMESNGFYRVNDWQPPYGYDPRLRPWYIAAKTSSQEVSLYSYLGVDVPAVSYISAIAPIMRDGAFIGVVSGDISLDFLQSVFEQQDGLFYSASMLIDVNGDVIFHPDPKMVGSNLIEEGAIDSAFLNNVKANGNEVRTFVNGGKTYVVAPILGSQFNLVSIISNEQFNEELFFEALALLTHFVLIFMVVMAVFYVGSRKILVPLVDLLELDSDTALPNKKKFKTIAQSEYLNKNIPGILMIINLDYFNALTAAYPISVIRQLLNMVKCRIQSKLSEDSVLGVFSESRFVVFIPKVQKSKVVTDAFLKELVDSLSLPYEMSNLEINLSIHIGAAKYPDSGVDIEELINNAFTAFSVSRKFGHPDHCLFDSHMNQKVGEQQLILSALRKGIRDDELYMVYQPQFDIQGNKMVSMEALVRWHSKELGRQIYPDEFIEVAENSELVGLLGNYVIEKIFKQITLWKIARLDVPKVAINVSAKHLLQCDFVLNLTAILDKYGLNASEIELELTETSVMEDPERAIDILNQLKDLGYGLAIDDFGSGYSSFQYLKLMPFNKLKIDRLFIKDLEHSNSDKVIIDSLAAIAENMNMSLLAEGVETVEQLAILRTLSVDSVQGYLFAKPLSVSDIETSIKQDVLDNACA